MQYIFYVILLWKSVFIPNKTKNWKKNKRNGNDWMLIKTERRSTNRSSKEFGTRSPFIVPRKGTRSRNAFLSERVPAHLCFYRRMDVNLTIKPVYRRRHYFVEWLRRGTFELSKNFFLAGAAAVSAIVVDESRSQTCYQQERQGVFDGDCFSGPLLNKKSTAWIYLSYPYSRH